MRFRKALSLGIVLGLLIPSYSDAVTTRVQAAGADAIRQSTLTAPLLTQPLKHRFLDLHHVRQTLGALLDKIVPPIDAFVMATSEGVSVPVAAMSSTGSGGGTTQPSLELDGDTNDAKLKTFLRELFHEVPSFGNLVPLESLMTHSEFADDPTANEISVNIHTPHGKIHLYLSRGTGAHMNRLRMTSDDLWLRRAVAEEVLWRALHWLKRRDFQTVALGARPFVTRTLTHWGYQNVPDHGMITLSLSDLQDLPPHRPGVLNALLSTVRSNPAQQRFEAEVPLDQIDPSLGALLVSVQEAFKDSAFFIALDPFFVLVRGDRFSPDAMFHLGVLTHHLNQSGQAWKSWDAFSAALKTQIKSWNLNLAPGVGALEEIIKLPEFSAELGYVFRITRNEISLVVPSRKNFLAQSA